MQNGIPCTDLVKIIKACGDCGVHSFKYLGLELELSGKRVLTEVEDASPENVYSVPSDMPSSVDPVPTVGYNSQIEEEEEEADEDLDQIMDDLKFTDPEAWDELAQEGVV